MDGILLKIYIAESAKIDGRPAYKYLVDYFKEKGFPGCTVLRGMAGFGHENVIHTVDVLRLSLDLPVTIEVVDTEERIMAVLPEIEKFVEHGQVTLQDVRMIRKSPE
ncbi:DUF190 domain-containing protein [Methanoregula sp.]|uniref:DUF190 domain-containing protein n=1 Tax=Methanoregula sp. TaxID=2052170 RepID=UPI003BAE8B3A